MYRPPSSLSNGVPPPGYTSYHSTTSSMALTNDDDDDEQILVEPNNPPLPPPKDGSHVNSGIKRKASTFATNISPTALSSSYYPPLQHQPALRHVHDDSCVYDHHTLSTSDNLLGAMQSGNPQQSQNAYPLPRADVRILTYPSEEGVYGYEEHGNEEDEVANTIWSGRLPLNDTRIFPTAPIPSPLPDPSVHQSHKRAVTITAKDTIGIGNLGDSMVAPPPTQMQPSNYVHLSRKCEPTKPDSNFWGHRKKQSTHISSRISSSAAITGTFIINPELYLTPGLLNAMEDPFVRLSSSDTENIEETRVNKSGTSRRHNLRLEVENGGIDVDVHLVPSVSDGSNETCTGDQLVMPVQAQVGVNATTMDFSGIDGFERQPPSLRKKKSLRPSKSIRKWPTVASRRDSKRNRPTTIDLRIKQANMQNDYIKVKQITPLPLIARIHAPNPRPPFHLFASTIDYIPNSTADSTHTPPSLLHSSSQLGFPSSSPLYLHIPRTFRGPLSIHISSGNVGTHLRLSEELEREVVLIRESEFGRGYFVGGLDWDDGEKDERRRTRAERGGGEKEREDEDGFNRPGGPIRSDEESSISSIKLSSPNNELWYGDRVEILVGSGDVYLQFEDEDEPFSSQKEVGFWKRLAREFRA